MSIKTLLLILPALLLISEASGQTPAIEYDLYQLNNKGRLTAVNRQVTSVDDGTRKSIRFSDTGEDGVCWIDGMDFSNGVIELDIRGTDVFQRSFVGVAFHGKDEKTLDAVYFRPFNFLAADSVRRIHAVQYISHPDYPWNKLRTEQNGKYEKAIGQSLNPNDWFPVKIVVNYPTVSVYVNNSATPCLTVEKLNTNTSGKIGLWAGFNSGGEFANLRISQR